MQKNVLNHCFKDIEGETSCLPYKLPEGMTCGCVMHLGGSLTLRQWYRNHLKILANISKQIYEQIINLLAATPETS